MTVYVTVAVRKHVMVAVSPRDGTWEGVRECVRAGVCLLAGLAGIDGSGEACILGGAV